MLDTISGRVKTENCVREMCLVLLNFKIPRNYFGDQLLDIEE